MYKAIKNKDDNGFDYLFTGSPVDLPKDAKFGELAYAFDGEYKGSIFMFNDETKEWVEQSGGSGSGGSTGGGLPSGGEPHKYLVTDENGDAKWEDALAYETKGVLIEEQEVSFRGGDFALIADITAQSRVDSFEAGRDYTIKIDGVAYDCTAFEYFDEVETSVFIGNLALSGMPTNDTGEPFLMNIEPVGGREGYVNVLISILGQPGIHTIELLGPSVKRIDPKYLPKTKVTNPVLQFYVELGSDGYSIDYIEGPTQQDLDYCFNEGSLSPLVPAWIYNDSNNTDSFSYATIIRNSDEDYFARIFWIDAEEGFMWTSLAMQDGDWTAYVQEES